MAALIGRHINRIDKKGRISVPKQFRDALSDQGFPGIYVYPSFKNPVIEACGDEFIQRIVASLDDLELFSDEQDDLASTILENSYQLPYDTGGRSAHRSSPLNVTGRHPSTALTFHRPASGRPSVPLVGLSSAELWAVHACLEAGPIRLLPH